VSGNHLRALFTLCQLLCKLCKQASIAKAATAASMPAAPPTAAACPVPTPHANGVPHANVAGRYSMRGSEVPHMVRSPLQLRVTGLKPMASCYQLVAGSASGHARSLEISQLHG